jgi:phage major head subunit gpT-like protein
MLANITLPAPSMMLVYSIGNKNFKAMVVSKRIDSSNVSMGIYSTDPLVSEINVTSSHPFKSLTYVSH